MFVTVSQKSDTKKARRHLQTVTSAGETFASRVFVREVRTHQLAWRPPGYRPESCPEGEEAEGIAPRWHPRKLLRCPQVVPKEFAVSEYREILAAVDGEVFFLTLGRTTPVHKPTKYPWHYPSAFPRLTNPATFSGQYPTHRSRAIPWRTDPGDCPRQSCGAILWAVPQAVPGAALRCTSAALMFTVWCTRMSPTSQDERG